MSLTRQLLNPLMWSHYGDSHQGVVVGFDVNIAGLSDEQLLKIGRDIKFDPSTFNLVKRAFLYKSFEWSYEEEVRIVKNISALTFGHHSNEGRYNEWCKITVAGRPLYCLDIPKESIKEIYLGLHIYKNVTEKKQIGSKELQSILRSWGEDNILLMQCKVGINSWNLVANGVTNKSDTIS